MLKDGSAKYVIGGLVLLIVAAGYYLYERSFVTGSILVPGFVSGSHCERDSDGDLMCEPVIGFLTAEGRRYDFDAGYSSNVTPSVGSPEAVYYDPADPTRATYSGFFGVFGIPGLIFLVGLALLWGGLGHASDFVYAGRTRWVDVLAALAGFALLVAAIVVSGPSGPGWVGLLAMVPAIAMSGAFLKLAGPGFSVSAIFAALGLPCLAAGSGALAGAFVIPEQLIAGWIVACGFCGFLCAALWAGPWTSFQDSLRDRKLYWAKLEDALAGSETTILVRVKEVGTNGLECVRRLKGGDGPELRARPETFDDTAVSPGDFVLIDGPHWTEEARAETESYRDAKVTFERVLASSRTVLSLGPQLGKQPTWLGLATGFSLAALPALILVPALTWAWTSPEPLERYMGFPPPRNAVAWNATVTETSGQMEIKEDDACTVAITPVRSGDFNCRVDLRCSGQTLYGMGSTGFTFCTLDGEGAVVAVRDASSVDGDAWLLVENGQARVGEDEGPAWSVTMSLQPAQ